MKVVYNAINIICIVVAVVGAIFIVTANQYFLIGDNMMDSLDSRIWGCIGRSAVQGIVIKKLF